MDVSPAKTATSAYAQSMGIPGLSPYASPASAGFGPALSQASPESGIIPGLSVYHSPAESRVTPPRKAAHNGLLTTPLEVGCHIFCQIWSLSIVKHVHTASLYAEPC